jgi:hypothetical protein
MSRIPPLILFYGLAGLIPFIAPPLATIAFPDFSGQFT